MTARVTVGVDLGKTHCRIEVRLPDGTRSVSSGVGAPGLAAPDGVERALAAIEVLLPQHPAAIVVGAAGALTDADAAITLARRLAISTGADVAVTSDAVTAHAGAFGGDAGTLLIAGTGSVAYRLSPAGDLRRAGGWGPWLGDEGSGQWIGRRGLAAVLAAADGRGAPTALTGRAAEFAPVDALPQWISGGEPAARLAQFAPSVVELAESGDGVAASIVEAAVLALCCLVQAVEAPGGIVRVAGGLVGSDYFMYRLLRELAAAGIIASKAVGTALGGAALLAVRRDLPHEALVYRA